MANIEPVGQGDVVSPSVRALSADDLPALLTLSKSAHWNQNAEDWRCMLALGQGFGIRGDGAGGAEGAERAAGAGGADGADDTTTLAASTVLLPYGRDFAWISMVLVLPDQRRRGLARQLLRHALAALKEQGRFAVLDATPAGRAVYLQHGFRDSWGFTRWSRQQAMPASATPGASSPAASLITRPLQERDWPTIDALDAPAFGASRLALLKSLAQRLPQAARVLEQGGRLVAYVLGRDGLAASQIGPLLAPDSHSAWALLRDALQAVSGPVYIDLLDARSELKPVLSAAGFAEQRGFTRMVQAPHRAPGSSGPLVLVAGPELG